MAGKIKPLQVKQVERLFTKRVKSGSSSSTMETIGRDLGFAHAIEEMNKVVSNSPIVKIGILGNAKPYPATRKKKKGSKKRRRKSKKEKSAKSIKSMKPTSVAEVAIKNEFGFTIESPKGKKIKVPERPFMRNTMDENERKFQAFAKRLIATIYIGRLNVDQALNILGAKISSKMKRVLTTGNWEANSPSTIARKGSSRPLIDTGRLRRSITWIAVSKPGSSDK